MVNPAAMRYQLYKEMMMVRMVANQWFPTIRGKIIVGDDDDDDDGDDDDDHYPGP